MHIDYLSFPATLIYLTMYYLVEKSIKMVYRQLNPMFYERIFLERKDLQYFVFIMGILITLVSTPVCYTAFRESSATNDTLGGPFQSTAGKICLASKGVLWTSELIRLDHSLGYIIHHLSSLLYLVSHLVIGFPLRPMYAFFTSLVTELISDYDCLLRLHGILPKTSRISYMVQHLRLAMLIVIRLPACIYAAYFIPLLPSENPAFWLNIAMLLSYTTFILNNISTLAGRLQMFKLVGEKPTSLHLFQRYYLSLYSIFLGLAAFITGLLVSILYCKSFSHKLNPAEISRMYIQLIITGFTSLFGAHNPYLYLQSSTGFNKNGLWIQGSILAASLSILLSPLTDRWRLFQCLAISLPIGEAIGRIGCHFSGCCGSISSVPLRSAVLNYLTGTSILLSYQLNYIGLEKATMLSLTTNAIIRLALRPNTFAALQIHSAGILYGLHYHLRTSPPIHSEGLDIPDKPISHPVIFKGEFDFDRLHVVWLSLMAMSALVAGGIVQVYHSGTVEISETPVQSEDLAGAPARPNQSPTDIKRRASTCSALLEGLGTEVEKNELMGLRKGAVVVRD